jgi:hypothetical protein
MKKLVDRSSRAYGALYTALDIDLRTQVTQGGDVPNDFAYGLWKWLERKFQSTEEDSVDLLLDQWNELHQGDGETFDAYRARVNHLDALLKHAGEEQSKRLYIYRLLRKLRPEYRRAGHQAEWPAQGPRKGGVGDGQCGDQRARAGHGAFRRQRRRCGSGCDGQRARPRARIR